MIKGERRGQITIFVIIALVIVGVVIFLFLLKKPGKIDVPAEDNPQLFLQKCIRESTLEAVKIMLPQGGFIEPKNYKLFENNKVEYLCYNEGYYYPCISQHPMLLNEMKQEIKNSIRDRVESCFTNLRLELERRGSKVQMQIGSPEIDVELMPGKINLVIMKKITITKGDDTRVFEKFDVGVISYLYDLGNVALEIANQEASYCNFEYVGHMILYPDFSIEKEARSDGTKIYKIEAKKSGEELYTAIRGCVIPPGV